MQAASTLVKTPKGVEEIEKRTHKLSGRLRAVLFIIDGQRTVGDLLEQAGSLAEQTKAQLSELAAQGFIREIAPVVAVDAAAPGADLTPLKEAAAKAAKELGERSGAYKPLPAKPPSTSTSAASVGPATTPSASRADEPLSVVKHRIGKMLTKTMGMRAMFLTNELSGISSRAALEIFLEEVARSIAMTSGAKSAETWLNDAKVLAGLSTT